MKPIPLALVVLLGLLLPSGCQKPAPRSPSLEITAALDTTVATIGDIIRFRVTVFNPGQRLLNYSPWTGTDTLEVRAATPFQSPGGDSSGMVFQVVFWDTGHFVIPPYEVAVLKADSSLDYTVQTKPLPVQVVSVLAQSGTRELRPVKQPVPVPLFWPWRTLGLLLLLGGLLAGIVLVWRQRQQREIGPTEMPLKLKAPPDEVARQKLRALQEARYLQRGAVKEFYVELSYLLREYVEHSFFIKTLEMTTQEIRALKDTFPFGSKLVTQWLEVLERADYTKYARGSVSAGVGERDLAWAESFIAQTLPYWKTWDLPPAEETVTSPSPPVAESTEG